jgi:DNA-binding XRE family transcriptional regulator
MEKKQIDLSDCVEWKPEFSSEALAHYERTRAASEPGILAIKRLRERLGLTQREMAELLMTTQSNVSKIEAKGDPSLSLLRRMVEGRGGRVRIIVEMGDGEQIELAA